MPDPDLVIVMLAGRGVTPARVIRDMIAGQEWHIKKPFARKFGTRQGWAQAVP